MKKVFVIVAAALGCLTMVACKTGQGCPSNGKNVGAERLLNPDKKQAKALKRVKKFKA